MTLGSRDNIPYEFANEFFMHLDRKYSICVLKMLVDKLLQRLKAKKQRLKAQTFSLWEIYLFADYVASLL